LNNKTPVILVTGADGQLGSELRDLAAAYPQYHFLFTSKEDLSITDRSSVELYFEDQSVSFCINCAAYTAVDIAETEQEKAFAVNATAVGHLAALCKQHNTQLIHISTDYVFDGTATSPYKETDDTCPISVYGASKLKGEELALENDPSCIIIRSSWIYSSYGNNFVKTMLRLMKEKNAINVVNDQFGCPTYAADLATCIMQVIVHLPTANCPLPTVFNYCNSGVTNWFAFALAIKEITGSDCIVKPIPTSQYPTAAQRPQYSVLDTSSIQQAFNITIPGWKDSLEKCLKRMASSK
jgi:dTDP-4-dehydrorhamnose reductase